MSEEIPQTLVGALRHAAALADAPREGAPAAIVRFLDRREREVVHTYPQILAEAEGVARALVAMGLRPGDRVALVLRTSPGFYHAFFGALIAGGIPVALYPPVRLGRLEAYHHRTAAMLAAVEARILVTDKRIRRVLGRTVAALDALPERRALSLGCVALEELPEGPAHAPIPVGADEPAFIQFSSGTTGDPKPVELTHRQLLANADIIREAILDAWPEAPPERVHSGVSWLPLYHDMGLVGAVLTALRQPGDLTLIPPEDFLARPALWLRAISRYGGTVSPAPNFAYGLCLKRVEAGDLEGVDLSSWRVALNGAEPVTPGVLARFVRRFAEYGLDPTALTPCYGLAEAALAVTFAPLDAPFTVTRFDPEALSRGEAVAHGEGRPLVSVGAALPGFEVEIRGEGGAPLPPGQIGRVHARGPSIMRGYHRRPEATAEILVGGWLDTGDEGFLHPDGSGQLFIHGRHKDLIIIRGRNHAPQDIEHPLDDVEGVRVGCCVAAGHLPEGSEGEQLVIFVERDPHLADPPEDEALAARVRQRVQACEGLTPDEIVVLAPGTLPRTSSGKIQRREALSRHLRGELNPPKPVTPLRLAVEVARSTVAHATRRRR